jgi:adenylate cyclase
MTTKGFKRKLTTILSADVKGYSRLMQDDEEATVRTITAYREVMTDRIKGHDGRVVDAKGDNVLAEFGSVVDAVRCGVEIQKELKLKNAELPENRRMEFRIGINLGDVIEEDDTIYGDGVNVAARLEGLSEGGGVCISGTAFDQVESKIGLEFDYFGEQSVKNIKKPVRVYRVQMESDISNLELSVGLSLPDKPSIAVLPFVNMSSDPEQDYFSDGITEEIITGLSNIRYLFVIARNSTFTYKEKPVKVQQVAEELGIRYVLEGSVRKAGNRVRITAQLVDAITGHHLWAERYDRDLKDIFAIQDEITMKILTALQVELTEGEQARLYGKGTENLEAYTKFLRAQKYFWKGDFSLSMQMVKEAIELDENYPAPYVLLAWTHWFEARLGWGESNAESLKQAYSASQKALTMDDTIPGVHAIIGCIHLYQRQHELAIAEGARAVALGPNNADVHAMMGHVLRFAGSFEESIDMTKKAVRLHPNYPSFYLMELAMCHYYLGKYEEAVAFAEQFRTLAQSHGEDNILWSSHLILAMNYIRLGQEKEARAAATEVLRLLPSFSLEWDRLYSCYKDPAHLERQHEDLRKAGLK